MAKRRRDSANYRPPMIWHLPPASSLVPGADVHSSNQSDPNSTHSQHDETGQIESDASSGAVQQVGSCTQAQYKLSQLSSSDFITFGPQLKFDATIGPKARICLKCKRVHSRVALEDKRTQARFNIWPSKPKRNASLQLLNLPSEIRSRIYDFLIIEEDSEDLSRLFWRMKYQDKWPLWNLIWSCRQLRDEGFYHYFGMTRFIVSITDLQNKTYVPWINQIGDAGCAALRRFELASAIRVSRYASTADQDRALVESFRIYFLLRVQLVADAPFCHAEAVNVQIEHNSYGRSNALSLQNSKTQQDFLRDSVLSCIVSQRRIELQNAMQATYTRTPLGSLGQHEIMSLMHFAAARRYHKTILQ